MSRQLTEQAAYNALAGRKVAKVVVSFSGGGDEGGADGYTFYDADGNELEFPRDPEVSNYDEAIGLDGEPIPAGTPIIWLHGEGVQKVKHPRYHYDVWPARRATDEEVALHRLYQAFEAPINAQYDSFAGDFHVSGTVTWDVQARTCVMKSSEGHRHYEDHESEVHW